MWVILLVTVLSLLCYYYIIAPLSYWKKRGIKYFKPLPILGNIGPTIFRQKSLSNLIEELYRAYPNERYVGFYQLSTPMLLIRDPEIIKLTTVKEFESFPNRYAYNTTDDTTILKNGLFNAPFEMWRNIRSTLSPSFTTSKLKTMFVLMDECGNQIVDYLQKQNKVVHLEMKDTFVRFASDIIATTAFGVTCDSLKTPKNDFFVMAKVFTTFTTIKTFMFYGYMAFPRLMRFLKMAVYDLDSCKFFTQVIEETIRVRQEKNFSRPDMVNALISARKGCAINEEINENEKRTKSESENDQTRRKIYLDDDVIAAQGLNIVFAGIDTTSTLLSFAAYELAINPDIQKRLQEEVDSVAEEYNGNIPYDVLLKMKYLDGVILEALRKWPAVPHLDRICSKQFVIPPKNPDEKPLVLEEGTVLWYPVFALHRDPIYYPDPEKFDPERFNTENKNSINPYAFLPFGFGPRNCIGSRFALVESKLLLAKLVQHFEFVPNEKTLIPMKLSKNISIVPDEGVWLGLRPRNRT